MLSVWPCLFISPKQFAQIGSVNPLRGFYGPFSSTVRHKHTQNGAMMKNIVTIIMLSLGLTIGTPVFASSPGNEFASCLADALNGKERRNLAKWIFFAMAAHPEIKTYSSASQIDTKETDKYVGELITRLLIVDCPNELKKASKSNPLAMQQGFELVGRVAMQELMTNQNVTKAITNYIKYVDTDKLNKILSEK